MEHVFFVAQKLPDTLEHVRFMFPHPDHFGDRVHRMQGHARDPENFLRRKLRPPPLGDLRGARIERNRRIVENLPVLGQRYRGLSLRGHAQRADGIALGRPRHFANHGLDGFGDLMRIQLHPARSRRKQGIFLIGGGEHFSLDVESHCLTSCCADINSEQAHFVSLPFLRQKQPPPSVLCVVVPPLMFPA